MSALQLYFPQRFGMPQDVQYFSKLKKHLLAKCEHLLDPKDPDKSKRAVRTAQEVDEDQKPRLMDSSADSVIIAREKEFESLKLALEKGGIQDPGSISVFKYYTLIEQMEKEQSKIKAKHNGRRKT